MSSAGQVNQLGPTRASFNFIDSCNMGCNFCYIPFEGGRSDIHTWVQVVGRLIDIGVSQITFGGGDPAAHAGFVELVAEARHRSGDLVLHVDTNGIGLSDVSSMRTFLPHIDLIGVPLDGSTEIIHGKVRGSARHFSQAVGCLEVLRNETAVVKINTVVTRDNIADLPSLARLVASLAPDLWSVYQFWPIGPIARHNRRLLSVNSRDFLNAVGRLSSVCVAPTLEPGPIAQRDGRYFLVTERGAVYVTDRLSYVWIGSIFDDAIVEKWLQAVDPALNHQRSLQRARVVRDSHRNTG